MLYSPEICAQSDPPPFKHNDFDHGYTMICTYQLCKWQSADTNILIGRGQTPFLLLSADNIWAMMTFRRIWGKVVRTVLCCIVCYNSAQWIAGFCLSMFVWCELNTCCRSVSLSAAKCRSHLHCCTFCDVWTSNMFFVSQTLLIQHTGETHYELSFCFKYIRACDCQYCVIANAQIFIASRLCTKQLTSFSSQSFVLGSTCICGAFGRMVTSQYSILSCYCTFISAEIHLVHVLGQYFLPVLSWSPRSFVKSLNLPYQSLLQSCFSLYSYYML